MAHFLAKQIIGDARWAMAPPLGARYGAAWRLIHAGRRLQFSSVALEVWEQGFRPDLIAHCDDFKVAIEVFVSHACSPEKIALIAERKVAAFEIDLSMFRYGIQSEAEFANAVLSTAPRTWIFHPRQAEENERLARDIRAERARKAAFERAAAEDVARAFAEQKAAADRAADRAAIVAAEAAARRAETQKALAIRAEAERKRIAVEQAAELERLYQAERSSFEQVAIYELGHAHAVKWATPERLRAILRKPPRDTSGRPLDWRQCLAAEAERVHADRERADEYRSKLTQEVIRHFRSRERGELWLRSTNPKLGRKRPLDFCTTAEAYLECVGALR
jgi:hypothetical protein